VCGGVYSVLRTETEKQSCAKTPKGRVKEEHKPIQYHKVTESAITQQSELDSAKRGELSSCLWEGRHCRSTAEHRPGWVGATAKRAICGVLSEGPRGAAANATSDRGGPLCSSFATLA
jgi:hypothetical protein